MLSLSRDSGNTPNYSLLLFACDCKQGFWTFTKICNAVVLIHFEVVVTFDHAPAENGTMGDGAAGALQLAVSRNDGQLSLIFARF